MRFSKYMKSLIETDTGNSSKSFALVASVIISFITGLVICFAITYDVISNGYIKTDLESTGVFMLCVGSFVAGSGIPKIFGDRTESKIAKIEEFQEDPEEYMRKKRTSKKKQKSEEYFDDDNFVPDEM